MSVKPSPLKSPAATAVVYPTDKSLRSIPAFAAMSPAALDAERWLSQSHRPLLGSTARKGKIRS